MQPSTPIIDIVAPASACSPGRLYAGLDALRSFGFEPRVPKGLFGRRGISANSDAARLDALASALRAPDSRLVWCVRGGYGGLRLLDALRRRRALGHKLLLGFSDTSALHALLTQHFGLTCLHAPVVAQLGGELDARSQAHVRQTSIALAHGEAVEFSYRLAPMNEAARGASRTATLRGTNLATVMSMAGTPWQPPGRGTAWCLEDVGERGYAIDRMLTQARLAGMFKGARAVVFGRFTRDEEANGRRTTPGVLRAFAESVNVPVYRGLDIGHGARNLCLPLGVQGRIDCEGTLSASVAAL